MSQITVKIKKGKATIDIDGIQGSSCEDITRALANALGITIESETKPAYFCELDSLKQNVTN